LGNFSFVSTFNFAFIKNPFFDGIDLKASLIGKERIRGFTPNNHFVFSHENFFLLILTSFFYILAEQQQQHGDIYSDGKR